MAINFHDPGRILHKVGGEMVVFEIANQDNNNATYYYYGYISAYGSWIVQRQHIIGSASIYEYFAGQLRTVYDALWNANGVYVGTLTFTTYDKIAAL